VVHCQEYGSINVAIARFVFQSFHLSGSTRCQKASQCISLNTLSAIFVNKDLTAHALFISHDLLSKLNSHFIAVFINWLILPVFDNHLAISAIFSHLLIFVNKSAAVAHQDIADKIISGANNAKASSLIQAANIFALLPFSQY